MSNLVMPRRTGSKRPTRAAEAGPRGWALVLKIVLMALVDAFGVFLAMSFAANDRYLVAGVIALVLIVINVIYFRTGYLAAKYIIPGLIFLLVFQVFVIAYTFYVSFTNYGYGHNIEKSEAIEIIQINSIDRVPGSDAYPISVLRGGPDLYLLATTPEGSALLGSSNTELAPVSTAEFKAGKAVAVPGYETLTMAELLRNQVEVTAIEVPLGANPAEGYLKTANGLKAYIYTSTMEYDSGIDAMVDTATGQIYRDNGDGNFQSAEGDELVPGWKVVVGFANYATALGVTGQPDIIGVFAWTLAFAVLSVFLSFSAGLALALLFNHPRMKGKRIYRIIMILPYAFPIFLSGLIWSGMLNQQYGFINEVLLGGAQVPWLQDPWLARMTVVLVSVWFGAPYFFLVCTGALQAIPEDVQQAAQVDGVSLWQLFRHIRLPLLLVAVSPLLIASFAFSFNDFSTIFMLSGGGPANPTSPIGAGATDILITVVYKLAFLPGSKDYGLASAFAVVIFLFITAMSIILFRRTKSLEDVY